MPTILDMPDDRFRTLDIRLSTPQQATRSGYTGARQIASNPWHGRWMLSAEHVPIVGEENFLSWRAFFAEVEGQAGLIRFPLGEGEQYDSAVTALVDGAGQTAPRTTLNARGFPSADPDFPKAGQFMTVGNQAVQIVTAAVGATSDKRVITFRPPLRNTPDDGADIEVVNPYAVVAFTESEVGWQVSAGQLYGFTISAVEEFVEPTVPFEGYDLALDFSASRYRVNATYTTDITTLGGYSYSRAGAKSELNSSGTPVAFAANVPGITSGAGYWSREATTNLTLNSQAIDLWTNKTNVTVTANAVTAPDGTATAETLSDGTATGSHFIAAASQNFTSGTNYTFSAFLKAGNHNLVQLIAPGSAFGASQYANFDLSAGTITASTGGTAAIIDCGNGWYRCVWTVAATTSTSGGAGVVVFITSPTATHAASHTGANRTIHAWQGQAVTSTHTDGGPIIVTTSSTASTGEDVLSHTVTALADEDMLIWARATPKRAGTITSGYLQLNDGTDANRVQLYGMNTGNYRGTVFSASVIVFDQTIAGFDTAEATLLMLRLSGTWRFGIYKGGTLSWAAAASTAAFPAGMDEAHVANFRGGTYPLRGVLGGAFIQPGSFSTDAAVIAALEAV